MEKGKIVSKVAIRLLDPSKMIEFYMTKDPAARAALTKELRHCCMTAITLFMDQEGEDAAEEAFDLTNNPSRQDEREQKYGRGRSVSVGDIVVVDGVEYLCASFGWTKLA